MERAPSSLPSPLPPNTCAQSCDHVKFACALLAYSLPALTFIIFLHILCALLTGLLCLFPLNDVAQRLFSQAEFRISNFLRIVSLMYFFFLIFFFFFLQWSLRMPERSLIVNNPESVDCVSEQLQTRSLSRATRLLFRCSK